MMTIKDLIELAKEFDENLIVKVGISKEPHEANTLVETSDTSVFIL